MRTSACRYEHTLQPHGWGPESARWPKESRQDFAFDTYPRSIRKSLQKALRIDVNFERNFTRGFRRRRHPGAQIGREIERARRFHQDTKAVATADERERRFGGTEHPRRVRARRRLRETARMGLRGVLVGAGDHQRGEAAERRILGLLAQI